MKLRLSSDNYIYKYQGEYYADTSGSPDLYDRYLRVFESIRFVARTKTVNIPPSKDFVRLNPTKIEVWPFPFFQGPKEYARVYMKTISRLRNVVNGCDAAILRIPSTTAYRVLDKVIKKEIPFAIEVVIDPKDSLRSTQNLLHKYYYWSWYKSLKHACKKADGIACVTKEYLQRRYYPTKPDAFVANYSSIALPKSMYFHSRSFPQKTTFDIAHVAAQVKFEGRKGHKELLDAVSIALGKGCNLNVVFVGADYENGIKKLTEYAKKLGVESHIKFTGQLHTKIEVIEQLRECDAFVMPTKSEGLPRSIIEAISQGLPCITTNVSGNPELIQRDFLIDDFYDVETLADKIILLSKDREVYESTSRYNFQNSLNYEESVLQKSRDEFYTKLKEKVK